MGNDSNILFYYNKRYAGGESRILQEGDIALGWLVKVSSYIGGLGGGREASSLRENKISTLRRQLRDDSDVFT